MPSNSRRRKRAKPESEDDNASQAGPSAAPSEIKPTTAAQAAAKRRRLDLETSSAPPSSSSAPVVATSATTSNRRNRSRAATAKQSTILASNSAIEPVVKEEAPDDPVSTNAETLLDPLLQHRSPEEKATSDTSSLSALSDHDVLHVVKKEEPDEATPAVEEAPSIVTSKETVAESTVEPTRHYTRAEKGKGRAKSPQANQHLRDEKARLEAELAKLRGDLTTATSTIENQQSFLSKVSEAFTCNICLETLHLPLALTCGHVFCQDDLWNWFHRETGDSESDDDDDDSSGSSSDSDDDEDDDDSSSSEDDAPAPAPSRARRGDAGAAARPISVNSDNSDLVPVEDDYNTDDPLDDTASSKSPSPVAVRRGLRIQTTRGQQVAEQVAGASRSTAPRRNNATHPNATTGPSRQHSHTPVNATAPGPSTAGTPGRHPRVPPLARPKRSNLVCPQCRSRVSLPPFPIFAVRAVSDLLTAQASGRRAGSIDAERESNGITDSTWGGLFPRAASGIGRSGLLPHRRAAADGAAPWQTRFDERRVRARDEMRRQRWGNQDGDNAARGPRPQGPSNGAEENAIALSSDSESSNSSSAESDTGSLDELRNQVRHSQRTGEALTREQRTRAELHNLFSEARSFNQNSAAGQGSQARPFFNGQHRREEAEHLLVNDRSRRNRLDLLTATRDERRRLYRRAGRAAVTGAEEADLRDAEDRAIAAIRRELLLSRAERARNHASSSRDRDILRHGIRDAEDGVRRCIDCNWEIENGRCEHCGVVYDSESEFDDNGEDLEGEVTSPPRSTQEASEMSFIERDGPSEQDRESFVDGTEDEGEDLMDSEEEDNTGTEESDGDANGEASERRGKRKVSRFMYDSEEDELEEEEEAEGDSFFVADNEIEHMGTSEADGLLDDDEEAEETDREEKRARREERRQAKDARRVQAQQAKGSSSGYSSNDAEEDEDSSSSENEESGPLQSNSLTSPSVKDEEDEDIPTISSQKVRREMQERVKKHKSSLSAREQAAKAAMSRNSRLEVPETAKSGTSAAESQGSTASATARKKRVIEASDEE